jgi:hypothetical protein
MKKILTHLTGIAFIIAILVAVGCSNRNQQNGSLPEEIDPAEAAIQREQALEDLKQEVIYVKAVKINNKVHLFMYDEKRSADCGVIDDHLVVVKRGYTVMWKKAEDSKTKIEYIKSVGGDGTFFGAKVKEEEADNKKFHKLVIPDLISTLYDTIVKYEIGFTDPDIDTLDPNKIYKIDPYLKVPPKNPTD